jgi:hypothetical protein
MIKCVFTLDYEIYGNGVGSLSDLVLDPTQRLAELFLKFDMPFVVFPEALEFARIEEVHSDPDAASIRAQLRELRGAGHEMALHIHPWWAKAQFEDGHWRMDWTERNICALELDRIEAIISDAIGYLRDALNDPCFLPFSFRSGLWAMQPTATIAKALVRQGICVDSSVFKGGRIYGLNLDYRPALRNGGSWRFSNDVSIPDACGKLLEIPIYTQMVPFWKMLGGKRLKLHRKVPSAPDGAPLTRRWHDYFRFRYPRKFDFCRMTFAGMRQVIDQAFSEGQTGQGESQILVAIGHTKDLVDFDTVEKLLSYLKNKSIRVTTLEQIYHQGNAAHLL